MYIENIVVGSPIVSYIDYLSNDLKDWFENEFKKTHFTNERFLPKLLVECGVVKSVSEVLRNKPEFKITLDKLDYMEIKWGKRKLFILVGNEVYPCKNEGSLETEYFKEEKKNSVTL